MEIDQKLFQPHSISITFYLTKLTWNRIMQCVFSIRNVLNWMIQVKLLAFEKNYKTNSSKGLFLVHILPVKFKYFLNFHLSTSAARAWALFITKFRSQFEYERNFIFHFLVYSQSGIVYSHHFQNSRNVKLIGFAIKQCFTLTRQKSFFDKNRMSKSTKHTE